jgi:Protein of unknown function (DUF3828)
MKYLAFFGFCFLTILSCTDNSKTGAEKMPPSVSNDSTEIAATIHGFFTWYDALQQDTTKPFDITNNSGKHLTINEKALKIYLGEFQKSGFVTESFVANEFDYYQKCAKLWQNETVDDVPSGMDADKMFCAQDWDINMWTKLPVRIVKTDDTHIKATLYAKDTNGDFERHFELTKENGKWLLSKVVCDMGIK